MHETAPATAITNELHRIAEAMDAADYDALRSLLAHASLIDGISGSELACGGDAAVEHLTSVVRTHPDGTWRTRHVTTNAIIDFDDEGATCRSVYTLFQQTERLPLQPILTGRYHDRFAEIGGTWRLVERRYFVDLVGDLDDHLTITLRS